MHTCCFVVVVVVVVAAAVVTLTLVVSDGSSAEGSLAVAVPSDAVVPRCEGSYDKYVCAADRLSALCQVCALPHFFTVKPPVVLRFQRRVEETRQRSGFRTSHTG